MSLDAIDELEEVIQGEPPTEEELFLKAWGQESVKRNIPFLNEVLRSLLTLATALSGASLVFAQQTQPALRVAAAALFLCGLLAALRGVLPYEGEASYLVPAAVLHHKQRALRAKLACVKASAGLIVVGLVVAMVGLVTF